MKSSRAKRKRENAAFNRANWYSYKPLRRRARKRVVEFALGTHFTSEVAQRHPIVDQLQLIAVAHCMSGVNAISHRYFKNAGGLEAVKWHVERDPEELKVILDHEITLEWAESVKRSQGQKLSPAHQARYDQIVAEKREEVEGKRAAAGL